MVKKRIAKQHPGIMAAAMSLAIIALAGCSAGNAEQPAGSDVQSSDSEMQQEALESGKVELKVWAEEGNFETLGKMIESFEKEYAGQADFEITLEASADGEARNNVLGDIHNSADIFSMPDDQLYSLIAGGALSPVANQDQVKNANLEEAVDAASYKGTLYAYPYSADNGYFLYYDKNYFTDEDVKTLDGVLAAAEAAEKKVSMEFNSGWYLYSFFGNTGLEFGINEDGVTNYCNWNSTEGKIKGVDVAQALLDITASPAFVAQSDGDFVTGMQEGEVIAGISGVWNATSVKEAWGENYGACKLPTYTCKGEQIQMASFTGYKMFGVNAYSEHLEWAHKLADWLTNEENQTLRF
ncbi:MAG: extracellular solute-binding protein, partial [Lachnospiraceae bacterium]|nr:extracellular solute-binding protein [Lachnospiraceae bacterium]